MGTAERFLELASEIIRGAASSDARQRAEALVRRKQRSIIKLVKVAVWLLLATIAIPVVLITAGIFFGDHGFEGLIATPLGLLLAWAAILYAALRRRTVPRVIAKAELPQLPTRAEEWLEGQRRTLPATAQGQVDAISLRLTALGPQLRALDPQTSQALEVRRLIGEELPELVRGYQKVPQALQRQPLHGGPSPDRQLIEGLATIDEELGRLQTQLAADELHALAAHQRFLDLKYKRDKLG
jgi:hypothetical protein